MKKIIALSALMAALASANAMAVDANLTFSGSVTSSTCTMNSSDATKTLSLPDASSAALVGYGNNPFQVSAGTNVTFTSCPSSITSVNVTSVTTTGTQFNSNAATYTPASGSASGIYLAAILGGTSSSGGSVVKSDGSNPSFSVNPTAGTAVVPVKIGVVANKALVSTAAAPTAGNYSSAYTLTFSWS